MTNDEKVRKTALNTLVRFDISEQKNNDTQAQAIYEELRKRGVGPDEQEFTDVV